MANRERGEVTVKVKADDVEKTYRLHLTINSLCELEEKLSAEQKRDVLAQEVLLKAAKGQLRSVRLVVWASMLESHPDATLHEAGQLLTHVGGIGASIDVVGQLLASAKPDPDDAEPDRGARPLEAQVNGVVPSGPSSTSTGDA